jgi:Na+-transporting NADH:ubiquinone oxidoreductase subunit NqrA
MEQLVPINLLKQFNITSKTLLPEVKLEKSETETETETGFLEITNDDKIIKAFLISRGLIGPRTENSTLLRDALMKYAKTENKRLIFL